MEVTNVENFPINIRRYFFANIIVFSFHKKDTRERSINRGLWRRQIKNEAKFSLGGKIKVTGMFLEIRYQVLLKY